MSASRSLVCSTLLCAFVLAATDLRADESFVELFNGKDLTGWVVEGTKERAEAGETKPIWFVENEMIVCDAQDGKGFGFLRYDKQAGDFILHVEYRVSPRCNSGVGIRGVEFTGAIETRPSRASFEIQIMDDAGKSPSAQSSGALYDHVAPAASAAKPVGEWNQMDIECRGPKIKVTLNGQTVQDFDQTTVPELKDKPLKGYCSLQNHGRRVEFRAVRWKVLDGGPAK